MNSIDIKELSKEFDDIVNKRIKSLDLHKMGEFEYEAQEYENRQMKKLKQTKEKLLHLYQDKCIRYDELKKQQESKFIDYVIKTNSIATTIHNDKYNELVMKSNKLNEIEKVTSNNNLHERTRINKIMKLLKE